MLTKQDLQQIQELFKNERDVTRQIIFEELKPLKLDVSVLKKDVRTLKTGLRKVQKDLNVTIRLFDREYLDLDSRVRKIEDYLRLSNERD